MAGFKPVQNMGGGSYTGKIVTYAIGTGNGKALAVGDLVVIAGQSNAAGLQEVETITNTSLITGAIVSFSPNYSDLEQSGIAASTAGECQVSVGLDVLYETTSSTTVAATDVGQNAAVTATEASTAGGLRVSNMDLNTSSFGTATDQIRLEGLKDGGIAADSTVYVTINESSFATVGI